MSEYLFLLYFRQGVTTNFENIYMYIHTYIYIWKVEVLVAQSCLTLCDPMDCSPPGTSVHGIFPGKNTGAGCHFLLQGVFLAQ